MQLRELVSREFRLQTLDEFHDSSLFMGNLNTKGSETQAKFQQENEESAQSLNAILFTYIPTGNASIRFFHSRVRPCISRVLWPYTLIMLSYLIFKVFVWSPLTI